MATATFSGQECSRLGASSLASLKYENTLLKQRNEILALENSNLLAKLGQKHEKQNTCSNTETKLANTQNKEKQMQALSSLLECLERFLSKKQESSFISSEFQILRKMVESQASVFAILQSLQFLIANKTSETVAEKKSDYAKITEALNRRKDDFGRKQKIRGEYVHIVKQPQTKGQQSDLDIDFILRNCQRIVTKVKTQKTDIDSLDYAFRKMKRLCQLRQQMREKKEQLNKKERQSELGIPCLFSIEELSNHSMELHGKYREELMKLQNLIHQL